MNTATDQLEITSDNVFDGKREVFIYLVEIFVENVSSHLLLSIFFKDDAPTFINDSLG